MVTFPFQKMKNTYLSTPVVMGMDLFLSFLASVLVFISMDIFLGHMDSFPFPEPRLKFGFYAASVACSLIAFVLIPIDRIVIRHMSVRDLVTITGAALVKGGLMLLVGLAFRRISGTVILILVLDVLMTLFLLIAARVLMILVWEHFNQRVQEKYEHRRTMIYGTSEKGVSAMAQLRLSPHFEPVAFLGEGGSGRTIEGLPVFTAHSIEEQEKVLTGNRIDAVLFPTEREARAEENGLIRFCSLKGIKCLIASSVDELTEGGNLFRPREVKVEDLLGREEIEISLDAISAYFRGKTVLVTGAAGSIGSELCRQLAGFGVGELVLFDNAETPMHKLLLDMEERFPELDFVSVIGDVRHPERLDYAFRRFRPQVVFHAAAYKHVPIMEENPCEAVLVNVLGTRNVADKCLAYGVDCMVMISTDKAVNPTSVMGCTKRLAEIYVQSLGLATQIGAQSAGPAGSGKQETDPSGNASQPPQVRQKATRFVTTRFGNVLGSNGSVIPRFQEQIAKGGPVTVTHPEITRFFMTIPEACRLVMEAATLSSGNSICVFDMGEAVRIDDLARRMIRLAGFEPDVDIKIEYTGLRPGEKLYEEVLASEEDTLPAFHDRIRIAKVREYPYETVCEILTRMIRLARDVDIPPMMELMKELVPEYRSETTESN